MDLYDEDPNPDSSKAWKAAMLYGGLFIVLGIGFVFFRQGLLGGTLLFIGLLSALIGRIGGWWFHE